MRDWAAAGFKGTELGVCRNQEVRSGATQVNAGFQGGGGGF